MLGHNKWDLTSRDFANVRFCHGIKIGWKGAKRSEKRKD